VIASSHARPAAGLADDAARAVLAVLGIDGAARGRSAKGNRTK
jgi:hypothetical protein